MAVNVNLKTFHAAATELWRDYQQRGPGTVDQQTWRNLRGAWNRLGPELSSLDAEVMRACQLVFELCSRCAESPAGLNFVTGEIGLVPRLELHQALDTALQRIQAQISPGESRGV